jgi:hypothetical protein
MSLKDDNRDYCVSDETLDVLSAGEEYVDKKKADIQQALLDTCNLDDFNLSEKASAMLNLQLAWVYKLSIERDTLDILNDQRLIVKDEYVANMDSNEKVYRKNEFAEKNCEKLKKIDKAIKVQESIILFMTDAVGVIKNYGYVIRNMVDLKQLER